MSVNDLTKIFIKFMKNKLPKSMKMKLLENQKLLIKMM